jgi:hypothetical protein
VHQGRGGGERGFGCAKSGGCGFRPNQCFRIASQQIRQWLECTGDAWKESAIKVDQT